MVAEESHLTPIPIDDAVASLSAILSDESDYGRICSGKKEIEGILVVDAPHLIPLKAKAWMDLSDRKDQGEKIDKKDIKKHRNDVFRLFRLLSPEPLPEVPPTIGGDMREFLNRMASEDIELKNFGVRRPKEQVLSDLSIIYGAKGL